MIEDAASKNTASSHTEGSSIQRSLGLRLRKWIRAVADMRNTGDAKERLLEIAWFLKDVTLAAWDCGVSKRKRNVAGDLRALGAVVDVVLGRFVCS